MPADRKGTFLLDSHYLCWCCWVTFVVLTGHLAVGGCQSRLVMGWGSSPSDVLVSTEEVRNCQHSLSVTASNCPWCCKAQAAACQLAGEACPLLFQGLLCDSALVCFPYSCLKSLQVFCCPPTISDISTWMVLIGWTPAQG